ncbi:MAG: helix-turn-helix domain-containing protein [Myxococcota bacterium]
MSTSENPENRIFARNSDARHRHPIEKASRNVSLADGEERMLRSGDAARLLGVSSTNTVKNWLEGGAFPGAYKTRGGHWRFPESEVLAVKQQMKELRRRSEADEARPLTPPEFEDAGGALPRL